MLHNALNLLFWVLLIAYLYMAISVVDDNFKMLWARAKNAYNYGRINPVMIVVGCIEVCLILFVSAGWLGFVIVHLVSKIPDLFKRGK